MNWATAIPLTTILVVVFAAGGLFREVRLMRLTLSDVADQLEELTRRVGEVETWQATHEVESNEGRRVLREQLNEQLVRRRRRT